MVIRPTVCLGNDTNSIDGMEAMRSIQKGQVKFLAKGNVRAQNDFLAKLFDLAA